MTRAGKLLHPGLLHELFEQTAEAHPENTALICAGQRMTYAEVERRANRLARYLRSRDVKRGDCVAMLLPRSLGSLRRVAGHPEIRRRLRAARSRISGGTSRIHSRGLPGSGAGDNKISRDQGGKFPRRNYCARRMPDGNRLATRHKIRLRRNRRNAGRPLLHYLHLRLDRPAEGRANRTSQRLPSRARAKGKFSRCDRKTGFIRDFPSRSTPRSRKSGWHFSRARHSWSATMKWSTLAQGFPGCWPMPA